MAKLDEVDHAVPTVRDRIEGLSNYTGYQSEVIDKLIDMLADILIPDNKISLADPGEVGEDKITTSDIEMRLTMVAQRIDRNTSKLNHLMSRINL